MQNFGQIGEVPWPRLFNIVRNSEIITLKLPKICLHGYVFGTKRSTNVFAFVKFVLVPFIRRLIARESSLMSLSFRLFYMNTIIYTRQATAASENHYRLWDVAEKLNIFFTLQPELLRLERTVREL